MLLPLALHTVGLCALVAFLRAYLDGRLHHHQLHGAVALACLPHVAAAVCAGVLSLAVGMALLVGVNGWWWWKAGGRHDIRRHLTARAALLRAARSTAVDRT
ncbi:MULTISPECIES: hypothetical protein [unclassified Streptomyces]|uniref:hypothetical protein n=1 Tax=unclassified Streptomyces TaxID=2593676 RepID=UPI001F1DDF8F|nr:MULTISPECIES: hypothetical protein [unclassified Streptomyces]MCF0086664.1 hypothetical protein [Streptomyces sp. MH192]MCF0098818.1 hypothetical protein [Streptomyces sp. MH191]